MLVGAFFSELQDSAGWVEVASFFLGTPVVALAFSLMIRSIPLILELAAETRDAARARGLERSPRAYLTPLVLRVVAHARATGDALHARGLGDEV